VRESGLAWRSAWLPLARTRWVTGVHKGAGGLCVIGRNIERFRCAHVSCRAVAGGAFEVTGRPTAGSEANGVLSRQESRSAPQVHGHPKRLSLSSAAQEVQVGCAAEGCRLSTQGEGPERGADGGCRCDVQNMGSVTGAASVFRWAVQDAGCVEGPAFGWKAGQRPLSPIKG